MLRCIAMMLLFAAAANADEQVHSQLDMQVVPIPVKSYRLLSMSMDADGFVWVGSIHQAIHRYDPRTGQVENFQIPYAIRAANNCLCVGKKVYVLGQTYPKLVIFDRATKQFREVAYPSQKPNVWYGNVAEDGKHLFLFDRGGVGVIKWNTETDTGKVIPWLYEKLPFPSSGRYEPGAKAMWCNVWQMGVYRPLGIARLDAEKDEFTAFYPFPESDDSMELKPYTDPATTHFLPYTLKGKVVPFDLREKRWCRFLDVPDFGKRFAFMGGPVAHQGRYYFSLSTYNGTNTGCDGKPYHFLNGLLEFDPQSRQFAFPTLPVKDGYFQVAYMLSAGKHFFATGSNIREPNGTLNRDRAGEIVFWQTMKLETAKK